MLTNVCFVMTVDSTVIIYFTVIIVDDVRTVSDVLVWDVNNIVS